QNVPTDTYPVGLKIARSFFRLKPKVVDNAGTVRFTLEPLATGLLGGNSIKAGESLLMQLQIDSPVSLPYVTVNMPLPSGGEVVSEDPRLSLLTSDDSNNDNAAFNWDFMNWWWTHQDILDDRMVFFTTQLPAGTSKMQAIVRMEMPGTMQVNPAHL